tara:strand:+ start:6555 stop:6785 length:231 start_codon:yes stop_codon:yes gene_type:complete
MAKKPKVNREKLGDVIAQAVMMAEVLFPEPKSGASKKEWVVDFVNDKINLPLLNERQEEKLLEIIIDVVCGFVFRK